MDEIKNIEENNFLAKWLEGTISDQELESLVSEDDYIAYKKLKNGFDLLEKLERPVSPSFNVVKNKIDQKQNDKKHHQYYKLGFSIAATILVIFGLFFAFNSQEISYETPYAEQKTVSLPDGSEVVLNAKSDINFTEKEWETNRNIKLNGEAFFKVKKGSTFTVQTSNGQVTFLGTQFNVKDTGAFFEVVCYEGKVSVTNNKKEYRLIKRWNQ